ncbi:hypothetical protein DEV91_1561 [Phyllobacterium brassicacearum]|nr:hypothetical protein DEV91_1561 [Phyllobacterium brassicacearum]
MGATEPNDTRINPSMPMEFCETQMVSLADDRISSKRAAVNCSNA